jgi:pimeloyl-ACP methyl ester carboxylesterase
MTMLISLVAWAAGLTRVYVHNPDYPASDEEVAADLARMRSDPRPLERPLVVLGGYRAPPWSAGGAAERLRRAIHPNPDMLVISYPLGHDIPRIAADVVRRVEARWPGDDPHRTREIDVVGISMGGLVARAAAHTELLDEVLSAGKRLRIARLFTMATPHRGATLARRIAPDPAARSMKPGSEFLARLNATCHEPGYELVCYARLRDGWVGASNTAPPGQEPIWCGGNRLLSHFTVTGEDRMIADIARRLRGEPPLAGTGSRPPRD